jgi:hypothetical protein
MGDISQIWVRAHDDLVGWNYVDNSRLNRSMWTSDTHHILFALEIRTEKGSCGEKVGFDICIALATED